MSYDKFTPKAQPYNESRQIYFIRRKSYALSAYRLKQVLLYGMLQLVNTNHFKYSEKSSFKLK